MTIIFIDKNEALVKKVQEAIKYLPFKGVSAKCGDIFSEQGIIVSASNPRFTMGGGLDAAIASHFPDEVKLVQKKKKPMQVRDVMFTITVGEDFKATRALVAEALRFALDEKNHMKPNQTMLVSGLGTGIGGLDEDDFVWLFLQAVCEAYGYGWGIKFVKKDGTDWRTGKVLYKAGKWLEQEGAPKDGKDCGVGLHLGKDFVGAGNYNLPEKIFFCLYEKDNVCGTGSDKIRVSRLLPLVELPEWLGYGPNGKKFKKNLTKKFNAADYNPYHAQKLPTLAAIKKTKLRAQVWAQVRDQVGDQVWAQVWAQVGDQVRDQVWAQVWAQVRDQVGDQVRDQVWAQVGDQVRDQVWAQVGDQVWAQVGATSYWAVNVHFELGVSHWFGDFLALGVMPIFVKGKVKFFGENGTYLGEYDESEIRDL